MLEGRDHLSVKCEAWSAQIKDLRSDVGHLCEWNYPRAARVALPPRDEKAGYESGSDFWETKVGQVATIPPSAERGGMGASLETALFLLSFPLSFLVFPSCSWDCLGCGEEGALLWRWGAAWLCGRTGIPVVCRMARQLPRSTRVVFSWINVIDRTLLMHLVYVDGMPVVDLRCSSQLHCPRKASPLLVDPLLHCLLVEFNGGVEIWR